MSGPFYDGRLTARMRAYALRELNADLVGFANIERFEHAPRMMSPQGILPAARSVAVMAIHHPDGCVELGGLEHPQEIGPYKVQYWMNSRLDEMAYRLGVWLEREGYQAVPIVSSNIWRYKGYKELTEHFAPDLSHRHAAVAAGLADFGFSALAITPEFGARQRFVTVITDAALAPTPLLEPGSVCDDCRLCADMCMSDALTKELKGLSEVRIEDQVYTYADKNLWRCSWGEHFDLDLDLPKPEQVTEEVILEQVRCHGKRGGEMGSCLRYCVPEPRRVMDQSYTDAPRRRRDVTPDLAPGRDLVQRLEAISAEHGADAIWFSERDELAGLGLALEPLLPDGLTAVTVALRYRAPEGADTTAAARSYLLESCAYDLARELERFGHDSVCCTTFDAARLHEGVPQVSVGGKEGPDGAAAPSGPLAEVWRMASATVITTAAFEPTPRVFPPVAPGPLSGDRLRSRLGRLLAEWGADGIGVAPAERLAELQPQLASWFEGQTHLVARDQAVAFYPYDPEVRVEPIRVLTPGDHLPGARSVLVIGLRIPAATVEITAKPPAEAVGPYAFAQYEAANLLRLMGLRAIRQLEDLGYRAALTFDLCGTGSRVGNPRGEQPDTFCNRFAAVAAGLGRLTRAGFVTTPELGPNMRFVAIVTDAELPADEPLADDSLTAACDDCERCLAACSTAAFNGLAEVTVGGLTERFHTIERDRCDWAKRYSLIGAEGVNYLGWDLTIPPPEVITVEALAAGLRQHPTIPKYRPCNFEACLMACPMARAQA